MIAFAATVVIPAVLMALILASKALAHWSTR
jgi:hypothetical protein